MKIKIIPALAFALFVSFSSFANPVNDKVKTAFSEKFNDATEVSWNTTASYVKASFKMNDQTMFAYYSADGTLLGVSKNLVSTTLPIRLQSELKKASANGWIAELFEYSSDDENSYYATIETADQKVYLKSSTTNNWSLIKKEKKN
jgi:hypothetical protein